MRKLSFFQPKKQIDTRMICNTKCELNVVGCCSSMTWAAIVDCPVYIEWKKGNSKTE